MTNNKIFPLDELAMRIAELHKKGRKVVHCHGVFDLVHIGHIKHFEAARRLGDVLVVTLTPDRFVNKGPGRPMFTETLRAEALAAFTAVDFVAINCWPTAVEAIRLLHPDVYVKGKEYADAARDITGKIRDEAAAVHDVGGELVFTDEPTFSSSHIINRHESFLSQATRQYLEGFASRYTAREVFAYLEKARSLRVLVIGEAIIDEYQYCTAIGKSSKEPTLVVKALSSEKSAGGILAVANHVAGMAGRVTMLTTLGMQNPQEEFIRSQLRPGIKPIFLRRKDGPTIVKRRFIESYFFTKMLEVYDINDTELDARMNQRFCAQLRALVPAHDIVIVVDYGHGLISSEAIRILCDQSRFLALNAQSNAGNLGYHTISMYPRADYVTMTEGEARLEARDRRGNLNTVVIQVAEKLACPRLVVTRGSNGCLCYDREDGFCQVPAFAGRIVDRIGAGDAFLSISALCAVQGAPLEVTGFVGNCAGAQVVAVVGNKEPVDRIALLKQIETLMK